MEKPILFNTEMVQAILQGRKTQTRRIIKPQPKSIDEGPKNVKPFACWVDCAKWIKSPYQVGDILWVRETFNNEETNSILYAADKEFIDYGCKNVDDYLFMESEIKWKPSIHMPRAAARIFLKVTDIKVERVQDITEDGALKEGISPEENFETSRSYEARHLFEYTWDCIYEKQSNGWSKNPWVWVIEFERLEGKDEG